MTVIELATTPRRNRDVGVIDLGDDAALFHAARRDLHELNATAKAIWLEIDDHRSVGAIAHRLAARYRCDVDAIAGDVLAAMRFFEAADALCFEDRPRSGETRLMVPVDPAATCYTAVEATVSLRGTHREVLARLRRLLEPLRSSGVSEVDAAVTIDVEGDHCRIDDGREVTLARTADAAVAQVLSLINSLAARCLRDCVCFHAAAVVMKGRTVLMPAASESGKSTLSYALVRAGADYLSDEMIGVRVGSGSVVTYPKPLTLDAGAVNLFPELQGDPNVVDVAGELQVILSDVDRREPPRVDCVISPRFRFGLGAADVERLSRAEALRVLLDNSMDFAPLGGRAFERIGRLLDTVPVFRVSYGSVADALRAVDSVVR